ncbi:MAG: SCO family protein [Hyphomonadaceae bacterium]|nr:SCO family protein [Hyphomonadaceae bacterium]
MNEPVETPRRRLTGAVVPALAAAGLAAFVTMLLVGRNGAEKIAAGPSMENCILRNADGVGGPINLVDANGARVTQADFAGEPAVLYFGFTNCPDICPTSMYTLGAAQALPGSYDVQAVLITVDPARDNPERMGLYARTEGFPSGLIGLTGSQAQIDAALRAFQAHAARAEIEGAPPGVYNMDHTSFFYVLDGQWRTRALIRAQSGVTPEQVAACIAAGLERTDLPG